jgi:hypothetical protein
VLKMTRKTKIQSGVHSCIEGVTGQTGIPKICIHHYECWHCPFDQWIEEMAERQVSSENLKSEILSLEKSA